MPKITSLAQLHEIHQQYAPLLDSRTNGQGVEGGERLLLVCGGTGCHASRSEQLVADLQTLIAEHGLEGQVRASITGCFGFCEQGPIVEVFPDGVFYVQVKPEDAREIIEQHILNNRKVARLLYTNPATGEQIETQHDIPFYQRQKRVVLRHCGLINPEDMNEYLAAGGYLALGKVLAEMTPETVIQEIERSGLRGRGGAGFSTGRKWQFARTYESGEKFIICNADEGDPGAFMNRSVMEGDSHAVIEGMAIAGYAIGASQGYIYIRAEYPLAVRRLEIALDQAREHGLLGKNILGTGFDFDIDIRLGAGAFVCGEETALLNSVEGERGEPRSKPPFPAQRGLWQQPTIVNNVGTLANVPYIITHGADHFRTMGTETSKGTKVFALAGQVKNVGLVEVPMGTTLREIIYEIGGGVRNGEFKAVQTGGPSGGCIPSQFLDTPIDYESLRDIGSMMGSGGMIVMSDKDCMVNIAKFYLDFTVEESCGRCLPCRIGNKRMFEILNKITEGKGTDADLAELRDLAQVIVDTSLCGLGQTAPNPVLSTLEYFWDEYLAHVHDKRCPAGVCEQLLRYEIDPETCVGCTACARVCPVSCISGAVKKLHVIDQTRCVKCGACMEKCKFAAISKN